MKLTMNGVMIPAFRWALRWRVVRHAYGVGLWVPDRAMFPNRLILGLWIVFTLEWKVME